MDPQDRFAPARDGTRIWWRSSGAGEPTVVLTDGIACAGFIWKYLEKALARRRRVIHWNYRGHGRSEAPRDPARVTVQDCVDDLLAVLDAAGEARAVLAGHSMGVQVVLEAHRQAPGRVAGLLLLCGGPGRLLDSFHDSPLLGQVFPYAKEAVEAFPDFARVLFRKLVPTELAYQIGSALETNRRLVRRADLWPYLEDVAELDPGLFVRLLASAAAHDASDHLSKVDVPTLIVAGEKDTWTPMWLSVRMHSFIPGSEMVILPGGTHVGPIEHPALVDRSVEKFLARHFGEAPPRPGRAPRRSARRAAQGRK
jgi:pimeloyl-ACP methyl ester carboxylesterase